MSTSVEQPYAKKKKSLFLKGKQQLNHADSYEEVSLKVQMIIIGSESLFFQGWANFVFEYLFEVTAGELR